MKIKSYLSINIKEEKVWNQELRMHKFMDILEVKEIDCDAKILN